MSTNPTCSTVDSTNGKNHHGSGASLYKTSDSVISTVFANGHSCAKAADAAPEVTHNTAINATVATMPLEVIGVSPVRSSATDRKSIMASTETLVKCDARRVMVLVNVPLPGGSTARRSWAASRRRRWWRRGPTARCGRRVCGVLSSLHAEGRQAWRDDSQPCAPGEPDRSEQEYGGGGADREGAEHRALPHVGSDHAPHGASVVRLSRSDGQYRVPDVLHYRIAERGHACHRGREDVGRAAVGLVSRQAPVVQEPEEPPVCFVEHVGLSRCSSSGGRLWSRGYDPGAFRRTRRAPGLSSVGSRLVGSRLCVPLIGRPLPRPSSWLS